MHHSLGAQRRQTNEDNGMKWGLPTVSRHDPTEIQNMTTSKTTRKDLEVDIVVTESGTGKHTYTLHIEYMYCVSIPNHT